MAGWHEDFEDEAFPPEMWEDQDYPDEFFDDEEDDYPDDLFDDEPDQFRDDVEADADALASAGWGTDEDYGGYDDRDDYADYGEPY